ncbi:MAG: ketoacyl-ACP synthase III [Thermaerobacter sp.]|jgi:3-oxoacyl-[acyl-carrier-protein] synthase-3|nr:ketoacyl-ACP synthase III [Thermaerobacter sp.]
MYSAGILGVGCYVPEQVLTNRDLEEMVDTNDEWIVSRSGIRERRIAAPEEATSDLALQAARRALGDARLAPEELDLIIVGTDTPDMLFPATACLVQRGLGAYRAACFDLEAACSSVIYGLSIARQFIATGTYRHVLVIGSEILSRITDWSDRSTCVLFGDGAGALVVGRVEEGFGVLSTVLGSDGRAADILRVPAGGSRLPASHETVERRLHTLQMNGPEVYKFAVRVVERACDQALDQARIPKEDVELFVPHQANIRIIEGAARRFGFPMERVAVNVHRYGNMSMATIPVALQEAREEGRVHRGDHLLLVAFGAGMTWGAAVVRWSKED